MSKGDRKRDGRVNTINLRKIGKICFIFINQDRILMFAVFID